MGPALNGSATTTEAIRSTKQNSEEGLMAFSARHGIKLKTVAKLRKRTSVADLPTGPKDAKSKVLTLDEQAIVVAFRRLQNSNRSDVPFYMNTDSLKLSCQHILGF